MSRVGAFESVGLAPHPVLASLGRPSPPLRGGRESNSRAAGIWLQPRTADFRAAEI